MYGRASTKKYHHIREIIREAKGCLRWKKQVIRLPYLEPLRLEKKGNCQKEGPVMQARLPTAAVVLDGGHSFFTYGEEGCALTQGYYPDYTRMQEPLKEQMIKVL